MSAPKMITLHNAMNSKIDTLGIMPKHFTSFTVTVNLDHIVEIRLRSTTFDAVNDLYFVISLTNGEKVFVNKMVAHRAGFGTIRYTANADYDAVMTLMSNRLGG